MFCTVKSSQIFHIELSTKKNWELLHPTIIDPTDGRDICLLQFILFTKLPILLKTDKMNPGVELVYHHKMWTPYRRYISKK
ncbi:hypothetical protein AQUCO_04500052v1 [Aquilegia coerulea]|uniref:Uncharacterized protein n=1 Tax=Aquilegia coerulea TaxID=218851 RepID=A0A2G5CLL8_AQUCA|nr:hypothetical protein AQUCO_04500052v1 [Aquilegia coerulea]